MRDWSAEVGSAAAVPGAKTARKARRDVRRMNTIGDDPFMAADWEPETWEVRRLQHDFGADAGVGENLEQDGMWNAAVDEGDLVDAGLDGDDGGVDFGDHALIDDAG